MERQQKGFQGKRRDYASEHGNMVGSLSFTKRRPDRMKSKTLPANKMSYTPDGMRAPDGANE